MDLLTVTVKIANRSYRIKIDREEEERVRRAVEQINKSIKDYADNIAYKDETDLLALTALEAKIAQMKAEEEKGEMEKEVFDQLNLLENLLPNEQER